MKRIKFFLFLVFAVLITGCASSTKALEPTQPVPSNLLVSITPEKVATATNPNEETPSPSKQGSLTNPSIPSCRNSGIPSAPTEDFGIEGKIIFQEFGANEINAMGGMPLRDWKIFPPSTFDIGLIGASANGKWFAVYPKMDGEVTEPIDHLSFFLIGDDGSRIEKRIALTDWIKDHGEIGKIKGWSSSGWLGSDYLYGYVYVQAPGTEAYDIVYPGLIDPFAQEWSDNIYSQVQDRDFQQKVAFTSDLLRILYTTQQGVFLKDLTTPKSLLIDNRKDLLRSGNTSGPFFSWASDNSMAAYIAKIPTVDVHDVTILSRDGIVKKTLLLPGDTNSPGGIWPITLGWSPDNEQIAFIGEKILDPMKSSRAYVLFVYDVIEEEFVYRCPLALSSLSPQILWSPDGRYILPYNFEELTSLILYDTQNQEVINLSTDGIVGGWLK